MRTEVYYRDPAIDGRARKTLAKLQSSVNPGITNVGIADVYLTKNIRGMTPELATFLFSDAVAQRTNNDDFLADSNYVPDWRYIAEVTYRPGVTNPTAITSRKAIETALGRKLASDEMVQTAVQYLIAGPELSDTEVADMLTSFFNPLVQQAEFISREEWATEKLPAFYPYKVAASEVSIKEFDLAAMDDQQLMKLSEERLLALNLQEMQSVRKYFADPEVIAARKAAGMGRATDVELEMIGQTWSEHCKHKIFGADIEYTDTEKNTKENIKSLYASYIKKTTKDLWDKKPFLRSVFSDNSGVVEFDKDNLVCFKVETHNSPSALDPYGGAITGIVGVNRDIIGTGKGARPFFNTDFLCFGDPDTPDDAIPGNLLHPKTVMSGVHHGIIDGGNQSGIPTVAGGFLFDDSYTGKPLVFCGTGGIMPAEMEGEGTWIKHINPGDKAVMLGGRIGKDGIHGATFSSLVLDEASPVSAVQIGDPITQKKMSDFLMEARDLGLYKGITDNGAGGLSSSLGEMAEYSGGIVIDLDKCPLKYQGLAPWEILVSESQERMSLAVEEKNLKAFLELAEKRDVEATIVGEFNDSGYLNILGGGRLSALLSMDFLHKGLPSMKLKAVWERKGQPDVKLQDTCLKCALKQILSDPNVSSRETLVRQYDHEVGAVSVVKPFVGVNSDAPSDGAVLKPVYNSTKGVTVTHGICPRVGDWDTYNMALCAVDEAYRSHIALGGDPDSASVLDNFCWPDPVKSEKTPDGEYKLAQLVRTCKGVNRICLDYGLPLISGKDSMKNDASMNGKKVSVRPTLLISLMGMIKDVSKAMTSDFKAAGDAVYILGNTTGKMGGSTYEKLSKGSLGESPAVDTEVAFDMYKKLSCAIEKGIVASCHDMSDGGLAVCVCESAMGGMCGCTIDTGKLPGVKADFEDARTLFCESPSRFVVSVKKENCAEFEKIMAGTPFARAGETNSGDEIIFRKGDKELIKIGLADVISAWKREI
ncbi:MAG: AIR synthase-related protein [Spirochaetia bacterium]|nr:AIR synthase-related protein [Spirochaetia bacterium]